MDDRRSQPVVPGRLACRHVIATEPQHDHVLVAKVGDDPGSWTTTTKGHPLASRSIATASALPARTTTTLHEAGVPVVGATAHRWVGRHHGLTVPSEGAHELVVVANRLPVCAGPDGAWKPSPGGLVSALAPVARRLGGAWVGWSGQSDSVDPAFVRDGVALRPVSLAARELDAFYSGYANAGLWPLLHDAMRPSRREPSWWEAYIKVNARFARHAAQAATRGARVLVQDYHFMLVPAMLRRVRPDLRIAFFLHTPFPDIDTFLAFPDADDLLRGLLGADVIGVQTPRDLRHLTAAVSQVIGGGCLDGSHAKARRLPVVEAFPISIDTADIEAKASTSMTAGRCVALRRALGSPQHLLLGVDRLDYTKGIEARLAAYRQVLRSGVLDPATTVLVQNCVPSRETVAEYQATRQAVEALVREINGEFALCGHPVVDCRFESLAFDDLVAHYRAADVMLVTPIRDGMNLVAKEYVASRVDGTGALVLSTGAGAAAELVAAHLVDAADVDDIARGISAAVSEPDRGAARMTALRQVVRDNDVERWASDLMRSLQ
jgi:trehalose 6-phosphate synthase